MRRIDFHACLLGALLLTGCGKDEPKPNPAPVEPAPPDVFPLPEGPGASSNPVTKVREAAARAQSSNNLKQIALSFHNYASTYQDEFPPVAFSEPPGKQLLSWRVAILPYIEQQYLYEQFHRNEPWDSPHNKTLIPRMPKTYQLPGRDTEPGVTYYRLLVGDLQKLRPDEMPLFAKPTIGADAIRDRVFIGNIPDGTSNTILAFEGGEGIIWTKPEELEYNPKQKIPPFGFVNGNVCMVAFADGSVRAIPRTIEESTLRALITRAGGEVIPSDW